MSLWYAVGLAAAGLAVALTLITWAMRGLGPLITLPGPDGGPEGPLSGLRGILMFMVAGAPVVTMLAAMLLWIEPGQAPVRELTRLGVMTCAVAVVQGVWAAARMPGIREDPSKMGNTVLVMAIMFLPAFAAMVLFFVAYFQGA